MQKETSQKFGQLREEFRRKVDVITTKKMKYIKSLFVRAENDDHAEEDLQGHRIIKDLKNYVEIAENIYSSLFVLLKYLRNKLPRFLFLSDEQVLNILSKASNPRVKPSITQSLKLKQIF